MVKAKIKIDIDNTISNMCEAMFDIYNERHGTNLRLDDCTQYDFSCFSESVREELYGMFGDQELYECMRPARNAVQYLFLLMREFDAKLVTATSPEHLVQKMEWIHLWFPFVKDSDVIVCEDKQWIGADYVIDDHFGYLRRDGAYRILIDMPWNRKIVDYVYNIHRVHDLKEAYGIIASCEKELEESYDEI